ncbi:MAG: DUF4982 domain-containing protein [Planctomycetota bacterium]|nr:DUF4982 domain-containing protein [Planctomycetota bacterium]
MRQRCTTWMNGFFAAAALLGLMLIPRAGRAQSPPTAFTQPITPRAVLNMNPNWKFIKQDVNGAQARDFDDSSWSVVSTPHTYNDVDTFNKIISHSGGQAGAYNGPAWYRKHFKLSADYAGRNIFIEFEGMRQAGRFFVNGKELGLYENGVTAYGLDISKAVHFGNEENILAVRIDNNNNYKEQSSDTVFQWESKNFNPNYGGINRNVWLHVTGKVYQTLPLYEGLQTVGTYIYPTDISVPNNTCTVNVESQAHNDSGDRQTVGLSAVVVDSDGQIRASFQGDPVDMVPGEKTILQASGSLRKARFWSPDDPSLYDVYTMLSIDGKVVDCCKNTTGFRKTAFKGGAGAGGVFINDKFIYLKGYSQRSSDEWAGLGQAYPDWMHDLNAQIVRGSNANYMRWMHITPQIVDVRSYDKYGIVEVAPAGDKEKDVTGRQWDQRIEVMRDSMIYLRNHPSVFFWEAGNNGISLEHMQQMKDLKDQWDPNGGRVIGCRTLNDPQTTGVAEYFGVMIGQDPRTDQLKGYTDLFRAYSAERRDKAPLIETEDFRDEAARRFWDDYSPPHFGFKKGPLDTYNWNSETFCVAAAQRYWAYYSNRISNTDPAHSKWSGYASIYFFDSNADGRQDSSEVCRVSGKVDAVRLPKEAYFTYRVMQSEKPDLHIIGHWTYPAGTKKTMYVVSNCQAVELFLNDHSLGKSSKPLVKDGAETGYIFAFPDIQWQPGTLKAIGLNDGKQACEGLLKTAGPATQIRLTPMVGPNGLQADGEDVALITVEVTDAEGNRCPTDEARIEFTCDGPGIWRGGYNSGIIDSNNKPFLNTECGVNRVSVRSTLTPGTIRITASRPGLAARSIEIESKPTVVSSGLTTEMPQRLSGLDANASR